MCTLVLGIIFTPCFCSGCFSRPPLSLCFDLWVFPSELAWIWLTGLPLASLRCFAFMRACSPFLVPACLWFWSPSTAAWCNDEAYSELQHRTGVEEVKGLTESDLPERLIPRSPAMDWSPCCRIWKSSSSAQAWMTCTANAFVLEYFKVLATKWMHSCQGHTKSEHAHCLELEAANGPGWYHFL